MEQNFGLTCQVKLLLDLRNGYNIGKLVTLDYNQKKKDGYWVEDDYRIQYMNDH